MSGLKGNPSRLKGILKGVRAVSTRAAQQIATKAAPVLSVFARAAFAAQQSPYGDPWGPKVDGSQPTLVKTGRTLASLGFTATGTILRAAIGSPYIRFLFGKWKILPSGKPPIKWGARLNDIAGETITRGLEGT